MFCIIFKSDIALIVVQSKYCKYTCFPLMGGHENKSVYLVSDVDGVSSVNHAHTELRQELSLILIQVKQLYRPRDGWC